MEKRLRWAEMRYYCEDIAGGPSGHSIIDRAINSDIRRPGFESMYVN